MSTSIEETEEKSESTQAEMNPDEYSSVSINALITGRKIESPIYDKNKTLLLAEGSVITKEIKQALAQRGEQQVMVDSNDLKRVTLSVDSIGDVKQAISFDTELTQKIDQIVDSGLLTVKNEGASVKSEVVFLGRQGYDQEQRDRLYNQHEKNGKALGNMLSEALHGESMDGGLVNTMAAEYLKEMTVDTDNALSSAVDQFGSDDLASRSLESSLLAMAIAIEMNLNPENCRILGIAGMVHDWGMMKVPKEIRNATHKLNDVEMLEIKKHPIYSLELLQRVSALPRLVSVISYQVHERINGQGYPRGRRGQSIHQFARILQVADCFVGMTSNRPHRPPIMRYAVMEYLVRQAKTKNVDPAVVRALLNVQSLFPIGSYVALNDGSIAQVVRRNKDHYTQPIIAKVQDQDGNKLDPLEDNNIIDLHENLELEVEQALPSPGSNEIDLCD